MARSGRAGKGLNAEHPAIRAITALVTMRSMELASCLAGLRDLGMNIRGMGNIGSIFLDPELFPTSHEPGDRNDGFLVQEVSRKSAAALHLQHEISALQAIKVSMMGTGMVHEPRIALFLTGRDLSDPMDATPGALGRITRRNPQKVRVNSRDQGREFHALLAGEPRIFDALQMLDLVTALAPDRGGKARQGEAGPGVMGMVDALVKTGILARSGKDVSGTDLTHAFRHVLRKAIARAAVS